MHELAVWLEVTRWSVLYKLLYAGSGMGDCLRAGIPSRCVTSHLGQLSLPCLRGRLIEYQPFYLGLGDAHSLVSGGR